MKYTFKQYIYTYNIYKLDSIYVQMYDVYILSSNPQAQFFVLCFFPWRGRLGHIHITRQWWSDVGFQVLLLSRLR